MIFIISADAQAKVVINELMAGDNNSSKNEFIELYNTDDSPVLLDRYKLTKKTASGSESNLVSSAKFLGTIPAKDYFVIAHPDFAEVIGADLSYSGASYSIAGNNTVLLYDADGKIIDTVGYGSATVFETVAAADPDDGESIGRLDGKDTDDNSQDFTLQNPTPGKENEKLKEIPKPEQTPEPKIYSDEIAINELLPSPDSGEKEYIELYNASAEKIELKDWSLHDASKSGEYVFSAADSIASREYLAIYEDVFKFALNNGGDESVTLYDPNKLAVSKIEYSGSKKGVSYNFDGKNWHWSRFLTPGKENIFEKIPVGQLNFSGTAYVDVYADFAISGLSKEAKVTWDFGDGHKSYLQKTRHKYGVLGKYSASVKFSEGSEDVVKNFTIDVVAIPHPKVKIVAVNANPEGSDTDLETLTVLNKSKKKINLNGWSVATGWKKLYNHPISTDFKIKAGKEKEITREFSKFTLNNEKTRIELRYPDGAVAYAMKYKKKEGIAEGEIYRKGKDGWKWQEIPKLVTHNPEPETQNPEPMVPSPEPETQNTEPDNAVEISKEDSPKPSIGKNKIVLLSVKPVANIELQNWQPQEPEVRFVQEIDGIYHFTPQFSEPDHYAIVFLKDISFYINSKANATLNYFLN